MMFLFLVSGFLRFGVVVGCMGYAVLWKMGDSDRVLM